jgi:hypothetical protein
MLVGLRVFFFSSFSFGSWLRVQDLQLGAWGLGFGALRCRIKAFRVRFSGAGV